MRFLLTLCFLLLISLPPAHAVETPISPDAAALVNGAVITTAEYRVERARLVRLRKKPDQKPEPAALAMTGKEALDNLIGRELLFQECVKRGISVQKGLVEADLAMLRGKYARVEEFNSSLEKMGLTEQALFRQIERGMAIQSLIEAEFGARTRISEAEARAHYDSHRTEYLQPVRIRLGHILAGIDAAADESRRAAARAKLEGLGKRIAAGEDFEALAVESDDAGSNKKGGDLGYYSPGQLGKSMEEAAFSLKAGQVSALVEDRFGFHLLKVTEREEERALTFEAVRDDIMKKLRRERTTALMTPFLKRLREAARVEIRLEAED